MANFLVFYLALELEKRFISPVITNISGPENLAEEFFSEFSIRYPELKDSMQILEKSCAEAKYDEDFIKCLSRGKVYLKDHEFREILKSIIGKTAWFSTKNRDLVIFDPNLIHLESDVKEILTNVIDLTKKFSLNKLSTDELIKTIADLKAELAIYETNPDIRTELNLRNFNGWETTIQGKSIILSDPVTRHNFKMQYDEFCEKVYTPVSFILNSAVLGLSSAFIYLTLNKVVRAFTTFVFQGTAIEKWTNKKEALVNNNELKKDLEKAIIVQQKRTKRSDRIINISETVQAVFAGLMIYNYLQNSNTDTENKPYDMSYLYDMIIFMYASVSLLFLIYQQWKNISFNSTVRNQTNALNEATKKIRNGDLKFYKSSNEEHLFFLPIIGYKRLPVERVEKIVATCLKEQGHVIASSNIHDNKAIQKKIAIKINPKTTDYVGVDKSLNQALKIENQSKKLEHQLKTLGNIIRSNDEIGMISLEEGQIARAVTFSFMRNRDAEEWKTFFESHLPLIKIEQKDTKLYLKVKLSKEDNFRQILKNAQIFKAQMDQSTISALAQPKGKERHASFNDTQSNIIDIANFHAKETKENLKEYKRKQQEEIAKQKAEAERNRNNASKKNNQEKKHESITFRFQVNDKSILSNPPYIEFSSEIKKAFNSDAEYDEFFKLAKAGELTRLKGSVHRSQIKLADFETGQAINQPSAKIRLGGIFSNTRAYTITEEGDGKKPLTYKVRGVSHKPHKK